MGGPSDQIHHPQRVCFPAPPTLTFLGSLWEAFLDATTRTQAALGSSCCNPTGVSLRPPSPGKPPSGSQPGCSHFSPPMGGSVCPPGGPPPSWERRGQSHREWPGRMTVSIAGHGWHGSWQGGAQSCPRELCGPDSLHACPVGPQEPWLDPLEANRA